MLRCHINSSSTHIKNAFFSCHHNTLNYVLKWAIKVVRVMCIFGLTMRLLFLVTNFIRIKSGTSDHFGFSGIILNDQILKNLSVLLFFWFTLDHRLSETAILLELLFHLIWAVRCDQCPVSFILTNYKSHHHIYRVAANTAKFYLSGALIYIGNFIYFYLYFSYTILCMSSFICTNMQYTEYIVLDCIVCVPLYSQALQLSQHKIYIIASLINVYVTSDLIFRSFLVV